MVLLPVAFILTFQSTLPCGSDRLRRYLDYHDSSISIHAPLRERQDLGLSDDGLP